MENPIDTLDLYRRKPLRHQDYISSSPVLQKIPLEQEIIIKCTLEEMVKEFFKDFIVVWHEPDGNSQKQRVELEKLCEIKTFTEWEKAVVFIQESKAACCHVVTSETNGELLVKEICSNQQDVSEIYVFSGSHLTWAKSYEKVLIETEVDGIIERIKESLSKWQKQSSSLKTTLPAFAPIFKDGDKTEINHLHRYLKVVPHFQSRQQAKNDFVNLSRSIFRDEKNKSWIDKFESEYNEYNKAEILSWYTQESFLYKVTNNCLRIATSDSIQYCRFLLRDLGRAIKEHYNKKSFDFSGLLFRGAYLSQGEWSSLKANINKDIEMHGFLSVSKSKSVALHFVEDDADKKVLITILVIRGPDEEEQGFAEVHEFSEYPQEKEIIFNVRSRFTILETEDKYSEEFPCRHLVLLYGGQSLRKFITKRGLKAPGSDFPVPNVKDISCYFCRESLTDVFFHTFRTWGSRAFFCKKCLPDFLEKNNVPLLMIHPKSFLPIKLKAYHCTKYPPREELPAVPLYGYKCEKCQAKNKSFYVKCRDCNDGKQKWCGDCLDNLQSCLIRRHLVVVENFPFSLWCERMTKSEEHHVDFQDTAVIELDSDLKQAEMFYETNQHEKALEYFKLYIQQNENQELSHSLIQCYDRIGEVYRNQGKYQLALEHFSTALELGKSLYGEDHHFLKGYYNSLGLLFHDLGDNKKALKCYLKCLELSKSFYGENHQNISTWYNNIGIVYNSQEENDKALEYFMRAVNITKSNYGESHPKIATEYSNIGTIYNDEKQYVKARGYYSKALKILVSSFGENDSRVATLDNNLGNLCSNESQYDKALEYYLKAMHICNFIHGEDHPSVAIYYCNMGRVYSQLEDFEQALQYHLKTLKIAKETYGENHPYLAITYSRMGEVYYAQRKGEKAIESHSKALAIYELLYGESSSSAAIALNNLGVVYLNEKQYEKALEYFRKALQIKRSFYGENHPEVAAVYNWLGNTYRSQKEYHKAIENHEKAIEICKSGSDASALAEFYLNIGNVYEEQGNYQKAIEYYLECSEINRNLNGEDHLKVGLSYEYLGVAYEGNKEYDKALEYHFKALKIRNSFHKGKHVDLACSYSNIADAYYAKESFKEALEYRLKVPEIRRLFDGENSPSMATCYNDIGVIYFDQGEYRNALEYYLKSLEIKKSLYGENHAKIATAYNNIGRVYEKQRDCEKALEYHFKSLEIKISAHGNNHTSVADSYCNIGQAYESQGKFNQALEYYLKCLDIEQLIPVNKSLGISITFSKIGSVYNSLGNYEKALEYHQKSLAIKTPACSSENHSLFIDSYRGLGRVCLNVGKFREAFEYHSKALVIAGGVFGGNHPQIATCYHDIADVYWNQGEQEKEALEYYSKSWEIRKIVFGEDHPDTKSVYDEMQKIKMN